MYKGFLWRIFDKILNTFLGQQIELISPICFKSTKKNNSYQDYYSFHLTLQLTRIFGKHLFPLAHFMTLIPFSTPLQFRLSVFTVSLNDKTPEKLDVFDISGTNTTIVGLPVVHPQNHNRVSNLCEITSCHIQKLTTKLHDFEHFGCVSRCVGASRPLSFSLIGSRTRTLHTEYKLTKLILQEISRNADGHISNFFNMN